MRKYENGSWRIMIAMMWIGLNCLIIWLDVLVHYTAYEVEYTQTYSVYL